MITKLATLTESGLQQSWCLDKLVGALSFKSIYCLIHRRVIDLTEKVFCQNEKKLGTQENR